MDQPIRNQTHDMQRAIVLRRVFHRGVERQIMKELATLNRVVDTFDVGEHYAAGAHAKMADIRISHYAWRQTDALSRRFNQSVRIPLEQFVVVRHPGERDRIAFAFGAITKTVKDDQREWTLSLIHSLPSGTRAL